MKARVEWLMCVAKWKDTMCGELGKGGLPVQVYSKMCVLEPCNTLRNLIKVNTSHFTITVSKNNSNGNGTGKLRVIQVENKAKM